MKQSLEIIDTEGLLSLLENDFAIFGDKITDNEKFSDVAEAILEKRKIILGILWERA